MFPLFAAVLALVVRANAGDESLFLLRRISHGFEGVQSFELCLHSCEFQFVLVQDEIVAGIVKSSIQSLEENYHFQVVQC